MKYRIFFDKSISSKKYSRQGGQTTLLMVLFIPILFMLAGAYEMIKNEESFKDYDIVLVEN